MIDLGTRNLHVRRWLLVGARVVDGSGAPARDADVRIVDDRIEAVAPGLAADGAEVVECRGLTLAPGFIDVHTHDDRLVLASPEVLPKISQGVTTCVVGNCGISLAPLVTDHPPPPLNLLGGADAFRFRRMREYADAVDATSPGVNVAALVGHSTLRTAVMGDPHRPATAAEQQAMASLCAEAIDDGAIGLSSGVSYAPGAPADLDELALLAGVAGARGTVYTAHIRDEAEAMPAALDEAFEAARRGGARLVVSHFKCMQPPSWGRSAERLAMLDRAAARQDVACDAYPYTASSTILRRDYLARGVAAMVTFSEPHPEMTGRMLADIAREWGTDEASAVDRLQPGGAIYFTMQEDDVRRILAHPRSMIGSDGLPHDAHPHPRLWGTFPRVLGHYSRDLGLFPLELAVHKMTGMSAARFGLEDRGLIRPGAWADVVLFDARRVLDRASFEAPTQPASGIEAVFVNGRPTWDGARSIGRSGRYLHRGRAAKKEAPCHGA